MEDLIVFNEYQWAQVEDEELVIGITEELVADLDEIIKLELPEEGEIVTMGDVVGVLETQNDSVNLCAPVSGKVAAINYMVQEELSAIADDPLQDGWLYKMEASSTEEVRQLLEGEDISVEEE